MITKPVPAPFALSVAGDAPADADALVVCAAKSKDGKPLSLPGLPEGPRREIQDLFKAGVFRGDSGETYVQPRGKGRPHYLILCGLGADALRADRLRLAVAAGIRRTRGLKASAVWTAWPTGLSAETAVRAAAEGAVLAAYTYDHFKSRKTPPLPVKRVLLSVPRRGERAKAEAGLRAGKALAEAQCYARDLCHGPANLITPLTTAESARLWAREKGLRFRMVTKQQLERMGAGAILGVGQGSVNPPCLVVLEHRPRGGAGKKPLLFVGKGVTFDTGGISLKPGANMHHMKGDMGGASAVIAALGACADLKVPVPVVGIAAMVENMPDARAQRPGDIVKSLSGITVEVLNTDAEGRLALCDAIEYGKRFKPAAILDIATLTGACAAALGQYAAGVFTQDAGIERAVREASERSGEKTWPMPIWEEYEKSMDSDVADLKNISGGPAAGATTAAVFLARFAAPYRWAHIDMAGPMWSDNPSPLQVKGPTGYGAKLLAQIAADWKA